MDLDIDQSGYREYCLMILTELKDSKLFEVRIDSEFGDAVEFSNL
jgi:hypothetical protein